MIYAKAFFDLQLEFARKAAALSGQPLTRVLLGYTNLYVRFGLGRDFDLAHPTWREYLAGLEDTNDSHGWTHRFYLARAGGLGRPVRTCQANPPPGVTGGWGVVAIGVDSSPV